MPAPRGTRQRRVLAHAKDPDELVLFAVRIPDRLRGKAHANAAALNMSAAAYLEQMLAEAPVLQSPQESLPLAESA